MNIFDGEIDKKNNNYISCRSRAPLMTNCAQITFEVIECEVVGIKIDLSLHKRICKIQHFENLFIM